MKTIHQPFETDQHDLVGFAAIDLIGNDDFRSLALKLTNYDADNFDPVAMKIFIQGKYPVLTLYALDKSRQEQSSFPNDKLPVKKFKIRLTWMELINCVSHFELVVSDGSYDLGDLRVVNK